MPRKPTGRPVGRPQKPHGRVNVRMPLELLDAAEEAAAHEGILVPELMRNALTQYLANHPATTHPSPMKRAAKR